MGIMDIAIKAFIPESEEGKVVNIIWTGSDEFKTFGKYKWKNGETKIIEDQEWWHVRGDIKGIEYMNNTYYGSSFSVENSMTFTTVNVITVRVQMNNELLQIGSIVGTGDIVPPEEEKRHSYCYGT